MKKHISLILIISLCLPFAMFNMANEGFAAVIKNTVTFEGEALDQPYKGIQNTLIKRKNLSKYLLIDSAEKNKPSLSFDIAETNESEIIFEYDFLPFLNSDKINIYLHGKDLDDPAGGYAYICTQINNQGVGDVMGNSFAYSFNTKYFYKIAYKINLNANTYDIYINNVKINTAAMPFRTKANLPSEVSAPSPINGRVNFFNIAMAGSSPPNSPVAFKGGFDNITVYTGALNTPVPTPTPTPKPTPKPSPSPVPTFMPLADIETVYLASPLPFSMDLEKANSLYNGQSGIYIRRNGVNTFLEMQSG